MVVLIETLQVLACSCLPQEIINVPLNFLTRFEQVKEHAPGEINLQSKQDLICHVAKVKFAASTHSMADVIPFRLIYYSLRIESFQKTKRKYILHAVKKTIFVILSVYACFKSFWRINISGCVIHGYVWYGRVQI